MPQIGILNGIYTTAASDFSESYPCNLVPIALEQGISKGYLRPGDGLIESGQGPGPTRAAINWLGQSYRVMGSKLCLIDVAGVCTVLGDVGEGGWAKMDYSFDRLGINSGTNLYYYAPTTGITQVTDVNLGPVYDMLWIDGYWMTTDRSNLVVTELDNPTVVNPLKYGSSEADPDDIQCLLKLRDELYALNRNTTEIFDNIGGSFFPFQKVTSGTIQRGAIGPRCGAVFMENIAFLGSGRNEAPAVWIANNGSSQNISTRHIEQILRTYAETTLSQALVEVRVTDNQQLLYIRLLDRTLVYDGKASLMLDQRVWYTLHSGVLSPLAYRAANFVWCYNQWLCGDPTSNIYGYTTLDSSRHYGNLIGWKFDTAIIYNEGNGAAFNESELVALTGRCDLGVNPTIWTSYSLDGMTWSGEKPIALGKQGERFKRLTWFNQGLMRNWRILKFRGNSDAHASFARLNVDLEALSV